MAGELAQHRHPVGIDMAHHHLQGRGGGHQCFELLQKGCRKRFPGGKEQHRRHGLARRRDPFAEQEAVGAGAPLEAVLHFEAQAVGAQAAQADQPRFDRQHNHPAPKGGGIAGFGSENGHQ